MGESYIKIDYTTYMKKALKDGWQDGYDNRKPQTNKRGFRVSRVYLREEFPDFFKNVDLFLNDAKGLINKNKTVIAGGHGMLIATILHKLGCKARKGDKAVLVTHTDRDDVERLVCPNTFHTQNVGTVAFKLKDDGNPLETDYLDETDSEHLQPLQYKVFPGPTKDEIQQKKSKAFKKERKKDRKIIEDWWTHCVEKLSSIESLRTQN